jgi:hypothetical protein
MTTSSALAILLASRENRKYREEETRREMADDIAEHLMKMTPAERRQFWEDHDKDTSGKS